MGGVIHHHPARASRGVGVAASLSAATARPSAAITSAARPGAPLGKASACLAAAWAAASGGAPV